MSSPNEDRIRELKAEGHPDKSAVLIAKNGSWGQEGRGRCSGGCREG